MVKTRHLKALPDRYSLLWYEIGNVLGYGGFGMTYLAQDTNLDQSVAIKEYLPGELATRDTDSTVQPSSEEHRATFRWGLDRFIEEARTLAKFRHPNIVRVLSVFEAQNTAYMVMEYEEGKSLHDIIKTDAPLDEQRLLEIIRPVADGLVYVHESGFIHRDIKPANIYIRKNGSPVLLDFGSARQAIGGQTRTLTSLVTPGYAPFEQYHDTGGKQGAWTDIYALGATVYTAISGRPPENALVRGTARLDGSADPYRKLINTSHEGYTQELMAATDCALAFRMQDRPQSVSDWLEMVQGTMPIPVPQAPEVIEEEGDDAVTIVAEPRAGEVKTERLEPVTDTETEPFLPEPGLDTGAVPTQKSGSTTRFIVPVFLIVALAVTATFIFMLKPEPTSPVTPETSPVEITTTAAKSVPKPDEQTIVVDLEAERAKLQARISSLKEQELEARKRAQARAEQQATAKEQAGTGQQAKIEAAKRESLAHKAQELEKKKQRILVAAFAEPGPRGTVNIEQLSMILARSMSSALHASASDEVKFKAIVRTLERGDYDKVAKIQGICMELKAGHALTANMNMGWSGKVRDLQLAYIDCSAGRIVKKVSETVTKTRKGWGFRSRTRDFLKQIGLGITQ